MGTGKGHNKRVSSTVLTSPTRETIQVIPDNDIIIADPDNKEWIDFHYNTMKQLSLGEYYLGKNTSFSEDEISFMLNEYFFDYLNNSTLFEDHETKKIRDHLIHQDYQLTCEQYLKLNPNPYIIIRLKNLIFGNDVAAIKINCGNIEAQAWSDGDNFNCKTQPNNCTASNILNVLTLSLKAKDGRISDANMYRLNSHLTDPGYTGVLDKVITDQKYRGSYQASPSTPTSGIAGKTIVLTGKMSKARQYMEQDIKQHGGIPQPRITKSTDILVTGQRTGSKVHKARQYGVEIISEGELRNRF